MIKTISFAIAHFTVAFSVTFALTGSLVIGGLVALVEPMINTVVYHFHEKLWDRIRARRARTQDAPQEVAGMPVGG